MLLNVTATLLGGHFNLYLRKKVLEVPYGKATPQFVVMDKFYRWSLDATFDSRNMAGAPEIVLRAPDETLQAKSAPLPRTTQLRA